MLKPESTLDSARQDEYRRKSTIDMGEGSTAQNLNITTINEQAITVDMPIPLSTKVSTRTTHQFYKNSIFSSGKNSIIRGSNHDDINPSPLRVTVNENSNDMLPSLNIKVLSFNTKIL